MFFAFFKRQILGRKRIILHINFGLTLENRNLKFEAIPIKTKLIIRDKWRTGSKQSYE